MKLYAGLMVLAVIIAVGQCALLSEKKKLKLLKALEKAEEEGSDLTERARSEINSQELKLLKALVMKKMKLKEEKKLKLKKNLKNKKLKNILKLLQEEAAEETSNTEDTGEEKPEGESGGEAKDETAAGNDEGESSSEESKEAETSGEESGSSDMECHEVTCGGLLYTVLDTVSDELATCKKEGEDSCTCCVNKAMAKDEESKLENEIAQSIGSLQEAKQDSAKLKKLKVIKKMLLKKLIGY